MMPVFLVASAKSAVAVHELYRDLGITYKCARYMCQRLRLAMSISPAAEEWSGKVVVSDETWVGGKPANRHGRPLKGSGMKRVPTDKTLVASLLRPDTARFAPR